MSTASLDDTIFNIKRPRLVGYRRLISFLDQLEGIHKMPARDRMPAMLLVADPGNGKTTAVTEHASNHKPDLGLGEDAATYPVILVRAPASTSEMTFYEKILHVLNAPPASKHRVDLVARQVYNLLITVKTRILIIDEFHDILKGPLKKQSYFLTVIKELHNELPISIVATGTREAYQALKSDRALESRFRPFELPNWQFDEELIALLQSFKDTWSLEFDPEALAPRILAIAGNTIGEISYLLECAAVACATEGHHKVTSRLLQNCGYVRRLDT